MLRKLTAMVMVLALVLACNPARSAVSSAKVYVLVDSTEISQGVSASLETVLDANVAPGSIPADMTFDGRLQFASGRSAPLQVVIAKKYANALSLRPVAGKPNTFNIVADGDPQPLDGPYELTLNERPVPGTLVVRISGQIVDPKNNKRVNFAVSNDPVPIIIIIGLLAGIAALICGAIVLSDDCISQANSQCGSAGVKQITIKRTYGFSWDKGGTEVGCHTDCGIKCNPPTPLGAAPPACLIPGQVWCPNETRCVPADYFDCNHCGCGIRR